MSKWHETGKNKSSSGTDAYSRSWKLRAWAGTLPTLGPHSCFSPGWAGDCACYFKAKVKSLSRVQLLGTSVHGILQTRILQWVAISFSRRSSQPRDQTFVSCKSPALADRFFTGQPLGNIFMYLHSQMCLIFKKWKDKKDVHRSTVHNSQNMEAT